MSWAECWGTYAATGPYNNVVMGGTSAGSMYGLDLTQAHNGGYGKGIEFTYHADTNTVDAHINLVGYGCDTSMSYIANQHYVTGNFTYDWYMDFYYSTDGGNNYTLVSQDKVAEHASTQNLAYGTNWYLSTIDYTKTVSLPADFTHVKIEVRGDTPAQRHQNIYTREIVISTFKPWAIRKSSVFKSLDVTSGWFKIRKSGSWTDKSEMLLSEANQPNVGVSRIRKSGTWRGQSKIGS